EFPMRVPRHAHRSRGPSRPGDHVPSVSHPVPTMGGVEIPIADPGFVARFWSYVDTTTGEWTGYRDDDGYGIFTWSGPAGTRVKFRAHRVAWAIVNGAQPTGVIRHLCDHPPCCRPGCLKDGTQADNIADRDDPRRRLARRTAALAAAGQHPLPLTI